ncbi:hypothetical protein SBA1_1030025 [Candidatus Sulfotelmatobacter kueseliae]|uniref:Uncharacterized protein n=1 Tax=Candidatus Sulfotelmatobacter kueseliae TaxID=2042962 RepID=A0A2U3JXI2_9BACT|nr:hypothetical protein SBA1_1030025 [Candidatus Sulfotelmatobacter kueseliae]
MSTISSMKEGNRKTARSARYAGTSTASSFVRSHTETKTVVAGTSANSVEVIAVVNGESGEHALHCNRSRRLAKQG